MADCMKMSASFPELSNTYSISSRITHSNASSGSLCHFYRSILSSLPIYSSRRKLEKSHRTCLLGRTLTLAFSCLVSLNDTFTARNNSWTLWGKAHWIGRRTRRLWMTLHLGVMQCCGYSLNRGSLRDLIRVMVKGRNSWSRSGIIGRVLLR